MIGTTIGRYEVLSELGAGGMGVVYRARDSVLGRDVALKLLAPSLTAEPEAVARFITEARAAAQLNHPNIVTVYEAGVDQGQVFIAMELVEGGDLRDGLAGPGHLAPDRATQLVCQIASALDYSHSQPKPVIHRDIKPANILLTEDGRPKLADFGIAKILGDATLTRSGVPIGTPLYMAPELFEGAKADAKTDLWSLGVVAYELLAGTHPFIDPNDPPDSLLTVLKRIAFDDPPRLRIGGASLDVEARADHVVRRALSKSPDARYESANDMALALQRSLERPAQVMKPRRWNAPVIALTVLVIGTAAFLPRSCSREPNADYSLAKASADNVLLQLTRPEVKKRVADPDFLVDYEPKLEVLATHVAILQRTAQSDQQRSQARYYEAVSDIYRAMHYIGVRDVSSLKSCVLKANENLESALSQGLPAEYRATMKQWLDDAKDFAGYKHIDMRSPEWQRLNLLEARL